MANSDLLKLRTAVRKILLDKAPSANSRWSDDELRGFFNAALLDMSRLAQRIKLGAPLSFAVNDEYQAFAPTDYLEIYTLEWTITGTGKKYELITGEEDYPTSDDTGDPTEYWHIDGNIYVRPIPNRAGTLTPVYYKRFADLMEDTDIPEPVDADDILKARALADALDYDGNALAEIWKKKYENLLGAWGVDEKRRYKQARRRRVRTQPFV